ncbi:hypothetical protein LGH82_21090 [Mesorhizobium sp. PAMC28654]|uniref:hypothetical protein n=1 Tax=Mesorhizobium sp. PAMC28654 TaxID=2880934 RepID=UPI001D09BEBB|nr:hypothetical protein [Mesorhizobium sp. PAMC28654]UDL87660.1 hypothetical protein LGH82_21090 [Mesorhizobium sp. PAMC28654]
MTNATIADRPGLPTSAAALTDPEAAINWALDCLEDFEVREFLKSRRAGEDLTSWLQHVKDVRQDAADMA